MLMRSIFMLMHSNDCPQGLLGPHLLKQANRQVEFDVAAFGPKWLAPT
jgi:hypothetical protein